MERLAMKLINCVKIMILLGVTNAMIYSLKLVKGINAAFHIQKNVLLILIVVQVLQSKINALTIFLLIQSKNVFGKVMLALKNRDHAMTLILNLLLPIAQI